MISKIPISEHFFSIQGEGINMGVPSLFIRLAGCNLRCVFCDTKYAWKGTTKIDVDKFYDYIVDLVRNSEYKVSNLVITGGEPMLYKEAIFPILKELLIHDVFENIEIETNGTIKPLDNFDYSGFTFNVSPKLFDAGVENEFILYNDGQIEVFSKLPSSIFKFLVYPSEIRNSFTLSFIKKHKIPEEKIWLMPLGATKKELEETSEIAVNMALKYGYKFSGRIQVWIWGQKPGV